MKTDSLPLNLQLLRTAQYNANSNPFVLLWTNGSLWFPGSDWVKNQLATTKELFFVLFFSLLAKSRKHTSYWQNFINHTSISEKRWGALCGVFGDMKKKRWLSGSTNIFIRLFVRYFLPNFSSNISRWFFENPLDSICALGRDGCNYFMDENTRTLVLRNFISKYFSTDQKVKLLVYNTLLTLI